MMDLYKERKSAAPVRQFRPLPPHPGSSDKNSASVSNNKQLLDEVEHDGPLGSYADFTFFYLEHDIMNYQNRGLCYLPKPKAEADNTDTRF